VLSCSPFIPKLEAPPFATLFFPFENTSLSVCCNFFFCFPMLSTSPP
jgi:hypothetical protein